MHNRCIVCNEYTEQSYNRQSMCGVCRIECKKIDALVKKNIALCQQYERNDGYMDGEQAAYYSGTPTECIGFASRGCRCGACMAREWRSMN